MNFSVVSHQVLLWTAPYTASHQSGSSLGGSHRHTSIPFTCEVINPAPEAEKNSGDLDPALLLEKTQQINVLLTVIETPLGSGAPFSAFSLEHQGQSSG